MLGKIEDKKRRGQQRVRWLDSITNSMDLNLNKLWDIVEMCCSPLGLKESDMTATEQLRELSQYNLTNLF